jgi:hypothetical protein
MSKQSAAFLGALWGELFGQPPPLATDDPTIMARILVYCMPPAPPYAAPGQLREPDPSHEPSPQD